MSKELWTSVIVFVEVLNKKLEDIHLNAKGFEFYAVHDVIAKIQDELNGICDTIQELYFGGRDLPFVSSNEIAELVFQNMPEQTNNLKEMIKQSRDVLDEILDVLSKINDDKDTSLGEADFCSSFSRTLQSKRYFLNALIK